MPPTYAPVNRHNTNITSTALDSMSECNTPGYPFVILLYFFQAYNVTLWPEQD